VNIKTEPRKYTKPTTNNGTGIGCLAKEYPARTNRKAGIENSEPRKRTFRLLAAKLPFGGKLLRRNPGACKKRVWRINEIVKMVARYDLLSGPSLRL